MFKAIFWFFRTIYLQSKFFLKLEWWEKRENIKLLILMMLILLGLRGKRNKISNTFFNLWDLPSFGKGLKKAVFSHNKMARVILDPKHKGVRAWEYGMLFSQVRIKKGLKVLDVGSGSSTLPFYLSKKGLRVTAFDLADDPLEKPNTDLLKLYPKVKYEKGSMLNLPFKSNTFDLVVCITAIEHLDYNFSKKEPIPYNTFLKHTKIALREMVRVLKKGGRLFLTSEVFFPNLQKTDRYPQAYFYPNRIGGVYKKDDFLKVFLNTLSNLKCLLIGKTDFNFDNILSNINRSNYRGRYFTTFSIYARKT